MTEHISGAGPIDPRDKKLYEQDYKRSADLFQKALDQYQKSDNPYQQAEFKNVMDKALQTLNESARGLMRQELESQNAKIAKDYADFKKFPGDQNTVEKLNHDLNQAKKSL